MPFGPLQDIIDDVKKNAIEQWDYSALFPQSNPDGTAYTGPRGPVFVDGWPFQLDSQLQGTKNAGQLTAPYISIYAVNFADEDRTFGDIYQANTGSGPLQLRLGRRLHPTIVISCWADQQLGGMDMCRKLAGYVYSALFFYRNSLKTIRGLRVTNSHELLAEAAMLYRIDLTITGRSLVVTDV
jgi:hypothetical protein